MKEAKELLRFIQESPSCFHAIKNLSDELDAKGFDLLQENELWNIKKGGKYYVVRNQSSVIAFTIPQDFTSLSFNMSASHSDSPTFKIKPNFELQAAGLYSQLNTETYGGPVMSTWLDRPLSIAGRVVVKEADAICTKLVKIDKDLLVIPNIAPHMNPEVGSGMKYNAQIDMVPLLCSKGEETGLYDILSKNLHIESESILATDMFLYVRDRGHIVGVADEFIMSPQLDDLACAYGCLQGFLEAENNKSINMYVCFDNEEVGSRTKQGAGSRFLSDTIQRIGGSLKLSKEAISCALANSFMVSADNAHAVHPNQPGRTDVKNNASLNGGIVIKYNANQSYTTDAISSAYFETVCKNAKVPVQKFANRSDSRGGSTLGAISTSQVSINSVDIGLPQLAMHSSTETAGVKDIVYLIQAMKEFYSSHSILLVNGTYKLEK